MNLSNYLLAGFSILPKVPVTIGGRTVDALFNDSTHADNKEFGGQVPDEQAIISIATSFFATHPKTLKGSLLYIGGAAWRVESVRYGATVTHLTIVNPSES